MRKKSQINVNNLFMSYEEDIILLQLQNGACLPNSIRGVLHCLTKRHLKGTNQFSMSVAYNRDSHAWVQQGLLLALFLSREIMQIGTCYPVTCSGVLVIKSSTRIHMGNVGISR